MQLKWLPLVKLKFAVSDYIADGGFVGLGKMMKNVKDSRRIWLREWWLNGPY